MKFYTCRKQKDVNSLKSIILGPDRLGKKHFLFIFARKDCFFWLSDVPIYQYLCRQVQIARKESYKWRDEMHRSVACESFKTISLSPLCIASLIKWETELTGP